MSEALLAQILVELRGLRADRTAERVPEKRLHPDDRAALAGLLGALECVGQSLFNAGDVVELARSSAFGAPELHNRIEIAIGRVIDDTAGKRLGKFLARCAGASVDGRRVERAGDDRDGAVWSVTRVAR